MMYLKNPYCKFTPLSDFSMHKRLIVTSLFRMSTGGYKPFTKYTDGITASAPSARARGSTWCFSSTTPS